MEIEIFKEAQAKCCDATVALFREMSKCFLSRARLKV